MRHNADSYLVASEASDVNVSLCGCLSACPLSGALHRVVFFSLSSLIPLISKAQTHCRECGHVRPLVLLPLFAVLHSDGSGAVFVHLERGRMCVCVLECVYVYDATNV